MYLQTQKFIEPTCVEFNLHLHPLFPVDNLKFMSSILVNKQVAHVILVHFLCRNLANNRIVEIGIPFHQILPKIVLLEVKGNPLQYIHPDSFAHLRHLKKL